MAGEFRVGAELGRGGTGVVYEAMRLSDGAPFAVKIMSLRGARDWKSVELFERGTQTLLHLRHANVPACYAYDRDERGRLYQVRERLDGGTLKQRVESHRGIPPDQLRAFLRTLLRTLDYLHSLSPPVVHRDIKPANIMFRSDDSEEPVLVDFEALSFGASPTGTTIVVSPGYTAPEQMAGHAEPASDLYSVGAVMLHVLTGSEPSKLRQWKGRHDLNAVSLHHHPSVVRVVARLLAPSLSERYGTAREALADLETKSLAIAPRVPQRPQLALLIGLVLLLVSSFAGTWLALDHAERELDLRRFDFENSLEGQAKTGGFVPGYEPHNRATIEAAAVQHGLRVDDLELREAAPDSLDELLMDRSIKLRATISTGIWPWAASYEHEQTLSVPFWDQPRPKLYSRPHAGRRWR